MNAQVRKFLPMIAATLVVIALATVLLRLRYEVNRAHQRTELHQQLEQLRSEFEQQLSNVAQTLVASALTHEGAAPQPAIGWQGWSLASDTKSYVTHNAGEPRIAEATLRQDLAQRTDAIGTPIIIGPFAGADGNDVMALAISDGRSRWWGETRAFIEFVAPRSLAPMMVQGYRVQLFDFGAGKALYQSDAGKLAEPAVVDMPFGATHLQWRAAPRTGWTMPVGTLSSTLFVLLAVLIWVTVEFRHGKSLREAAVDLDEAETRRRHINGLYGKALEDVAALESRLQVVSMYDTVTGLANRSSLIRRIESLLEGLRLKPGGSISILAIGFDHVHHITHSFGADFASRVLVVAAERVEFVLPAKDLLFRIGDFQLAIILPNIDSGTCKELSGKLINEIEAPISMDSHTFMLHPTVGITETSSGYEYAETLLDRANTALGAVPRDALERYCIFDSTTAKESVGRLQLEVDLNRAFEENEFVLEYEPIVLPVTNALAGFEALIRWNHPTDGRISPGKFVPIAIQAGMSNRLNQWVMREAARQAGEWRRAGYMNIFVNFNLSAEAFLRPKLEEEIGGLLAEFELPGNMLLVELTETTLIQDLRGAARTLQRLSELGIGAWLDDFGTGYSSLSYLRALPLKGVKIDRSFIERTIVDARDFGFLKSLIDLISYLGMKSIAEGIETQEQYELLSLTTCDLYQGYHFSRSMTAAQAERYMIEKGGVMRRALTA